jgi:hypothetical protein
MHAECFFCYERFNSCYFRNGLTPLHLSSKHGHVEVCQLLVQRNADVTARDKCVPPYTHIVFIALFHRRLTFFALGLVTLLSKKQSSRIRPTLSHICAAWVRLNESHTARCAACVPTVKCFPLPSTSVAAEAPCGALTSLWVAALKDCFRC